MDATGLKDISDSRLDVACGAVQVRALGLHCGSRLRCRWWWRREAGGLVRAKLVDECGTRRETWRWSRQWPRGSCGAQSRYRLICFLVTALPLPAVGHLAPPGRLGTFRCRRELKGFADPGRTRSVLWGRKGKVRLWVLQASRAIQESNKQRKKSRRQRSRDQETNQPFEAWHGRPSELVSASLARRSRDSSIESVSRGHLRTPRESLEPPQRMLQNSRCQSPSLPLLAVHHRDKVEVETRRMCSA